MFRLFFTLLLLISTLLAEEYPSSFAQLGTPLYKSVNAFSKYEEVEALYKQTQLFKKQAKKALENGYRVDTSSNKKEKKAYLLELRELQKEYDKLLHLLHKSIDEAIDRDDYQLFLKLTSYAFEGLFQNSNNTNRAIAFYSQNQHKLNCPILDKRIGDTKLMEETLELFKAEVINSAYDSNSKKKSNKSVRVVTDRVKNSIYVKFENRNIYPVTIKVKQKYKNLLLSHNVKDIIVVKANSMIEYVTLKVTNGDSFYSYNFSWIMGSKDARHSDEFIYRLPYKKGSSHYVSQGYNGTKTHKGSSAYAIDFPMSEGTKIYAARGGIVVKTKSNSNSGGYEKKYASSGNYVRILHKDGTFATYYHLKHKGVLVKEGDRVPQGFALGYSGNTGYSSGPHLHFSVFRATSSLKNKTIPIKILSEETLIEDPKIGERYTAK